MREKPGIYLILLVTLTLLSISCSEDVADNPVTGGPPKTFLWLYPEGDVGTGVSRTRLRWWGESPAGLVRGYLFSFMVVTSPVTSLPVPDTLRYSWVTANDSTVLFPLDTLFRRFTVVVRAVDYGFSGLPEHSIVRMVPFPFWDRNDNGAFDSGDDALEDLSGAIDPVGAVQTFPIRNTPPTIALLPNPNDATVLQKMPDITFTVATIGFKGSDADGDNTLASYRIALNDTSNVENWVTVTLRDTILTLVVPRSRSDGVDSSATVTADLYSGKFLGRRFVGQISNLRLGAYNVFYVQARDVAGEYSQALTLPSGTDRWYVKKPLSRILLVSDYTKFDASTAQETYLSILSPLAGGQFGEVDQLNIALGLTPTEKENGKFGRLVPNFTDPALIQTLLLYDCVLWFTDEIPSLGVAQLSLFTFLQNGGRVIFSTMFLNTADPRGALRDFAPIDSVSSVTLPPVTLPSVGDSRIPANYLVYPDSTNPADLYPLLAFNSSPTIHSVFMRPVYRRSDARYLYHLQPDTRVPMRYSGTPNIAVIDGQNRIIFVGLPLHLLNNAVQGNPLSLTAFFEKALQQFSPTQVVNRSIF